MKGVPNLEGMGTLTGLQVDRFAIFASEKKTLPFQIDSCRAHFARGPEYLRALPLRQCRSLPDELEPKLDLTR